MDVFVFDGEVDARAAHAGLHLVDDQESIGRAADGLRFAKIAGGNHSHAAFGLNRFDDKGREFRVASVRSIAPRNRRTECGDSRRRAAETPSDIPGCR